MAQLDADRVLETSNTAGAGSITVLGGVAGHRSLLQAGAVDGTTVDLYVEDVFPSTGVPTGAYEYGTYTWRTGGILERTTIRGSSNGGAPVSWGVGVRRVGMGMLAYMVAKVRQGSTAIQFMFDGATADADPGAGNLRANAATLGAVTMLYVSTADVDQNDISSSLDAMGLSTSPTTKATLQVREGATGRLGLFRVIGAPVNAGAYRKVPVVCIAGGAGLFAPGNQVGMSFAIAGDSPALAGADTQVQFNDGGAFGASPLFTFNKATGKLSIAGILAAASLSIASGALAASSPAVDAAQTWNAAGVSFTGLRLNVVDAASAVSSLLADLQVGGVSKWKADKAGNATAAGVMTAASFMQAGNNGFAIGATQPTRGVYAPLSSNSFTFYGSGAAFGLDYPNNALWLSAGLALGWETTIGVAPDLTLYRDAAGVLAQRNGLNPQSYLVYNVSTDPNNFERGYARWKSNIFQVGAEFLGTGVARQMDFQVGGTTRLSIGTAGTLTLTSPGITNAPALNINNLGAGTGGVAMNWAAGGSVSIDNSGNKFRIDTVNMGGGGIFFSARGSGDASGLFWFNGDAGAGAASDIFALMSTTWNNAAKTYTGIKFNTVDTASLAASLLMDFQVGGTSKFKVDKAGNVIAGGNSTSPNGFLCAGDNGYGLGYVNGNLLLFAGGSAGLVLTPSLSNYRIPSGYMFSWSSATTNLSGSDTGLSRLSAGVVGVGNGTAGTSAGTFVAGAFYAYNQNTDASNYDRASLGISGNFAVLQTQSAGTGVARHLALRTPASTSLYIGPGGGADSWIFQNTGHLIPGAANAYNMGSSNAPMSAVFSNALNVFNASGAAWVNFSQIGTQNYFALGFTPGAGMTMECRAGTSSGAILFGVTAGGRMIVGNGVTTAFDDQSTALQVLGGIRTDKTVKSGSYTVATLPAAATAGQGAAAFVTDSTVTHTAGVGAIVAGGGANKVPVYSDGVNWRIG